MNRALGLAVASLKTLTLRSILVAGTVSCAAVPQSIVLPPGGASERALHRYSSPIEHVVIIVQENRTPDYLFQGVPGADIAQTAVNSRGETVPLEPMSMAAGYDLDHGHGAFVRDYDGGKMDGFDKNLNRRQARGGPFRHAPRDEVRPYHEMAVQYVFADRMFQSDQAGSFPSHQYLVSGTSSALPLTSFDVSSDPYDRVTLQKGDAGCDASKYTVVDTINPHDGSPGPTPFPCFDRPVLSDLLDQRGVSWRYYQRNLGPGLWHAFDAISHVRYGPGYANVITPPETILNDVKKGRLPGVSWVMPADDLHSDHAGNGSAEGPTWVAAVVNAIGESAYWKSTAIFITWDDWGGWYDHVPPRQFDNSSNSDSASRSSSCRRMPKKATSRTCSHEFGSILAFCEKTFGIPKGALHATDRRADNLMDAFDFTQKPRTFKRIHAHRFVPAAAAAASLNAENP